MAYDNETYLKSLAASRGSIDRQVQNTLGEVQRQQDSAVAQTGKIGGAVQGTTAAATGQAHGLAERMQSTLDRFQLGHPDQGIRPNVDAIRANVGQRMQTVNDAWGRASGLLAQGFGEQGDQRRAQVGQIGDQLRTDNDLQRLAYVGQREAEDRSRAFALEQANRSDALAREQMGQQSGLAREGMAASAREAELDRQFQAQQALAGQVHQALLVNPYTGQPVPALPPSGRSPVSANQAERNAAPGRLNLAALLGRIR